MPWVPDIEIADVRNECGVITVDVRIDDLVTAAINGGKAYIESVLRKAGYDVTNPAADLSVRDATLAFIVCRLLSAIYGNQDWNDEVAGAFRSYLGRVRLFVSTDSELVVVPNLPRAPSSFAPLIIEPEAITESWPYTTVSDDALE